MQLLFRLPFALLEMVLRRGLGVVAEIAQLLQRSGDDDFVVPTPAARTAAPAGAPSAGPPPPSAEEVMGRRFEREAQAPLRAVAADDAGPGNGSGGHVDREAELVESFGPAGDSGARVKVDEPWDGYDGMAATAVIGRLRGADPATKGVVALYERQHKKRTTVLRAAG